MKKLVAGFTITMFVAAMATGVAWMFNPDMGWYLERANLAACALAVPGYLLWLVISLGEQEERELEDL
jgi:hypothetical protein